MANLESVVKRLETVATRLEAVGLKSGKGSSAAANDDSSEMVDAYDQILKKHLPRLQQLTDTIGSNELKEQVKSVSAAFNAQRAFLVIVSKCKPPSADELAKLLKPTSAAVSAVQDQKEKNRTSKQFNHLSCLSDWIAVFGWVSVPGKTGKYVKETSAGAQFYGNRIRTDFKGKDDNHIQWVNSIQPISDAMEAFAQEYHGNGLAWNVGGIFVRDAPTAGGPPPPPAAAAPPPPPPGSAAAPSKGSGKVADVGALFADLNKGSNVTTGLKKVDPSMQTHKNPALRAGAKVPAKTAAPAGGPKQTATVKSSAPKAPVFQKSGKKWMVEHQVGNREMVISDCNMKETVYIYKCVDSVVQVKNKINSIILDSCKKTAVVFEDVLSTCEFVNCQSVQAQANGAVPTISIDKTDGCQLYVNKKSCNADFITAKSSEMNVLMVNENGDTTEFPIPEQFKTKWTGKGLKTEVLDIVA